MAGTLHTYEYIPHRAADIVDAIASDPSLLVGPTASAVRRAESIRSRLHFAVGGFEVGRDAEILVGDTMVEPGAARIPIAWRSASASSLFPHMTAAIQITEISSSPPESCLALIGSYTPPFGVLGAVGDLLLGHQVAEATVREFVTGLARRLNAELGHRITGGADPERMEAQLRIAGSTG